MSQTIEERREYQKLYSRKRRLCPKFRRQACVYQKQYKSGGWASYQIERVFVSALRELLGLDPIPNASGEV